MSTAEGAYWDVGRGISDHDKRWLFDVVTEEGKPDKYVPKPELKGRIVYALQQMEKGEVPSILFRETLKDERRQLRHTTNLKNDPNFVPKTRSFTVCPVEFTILVRMFCFSFVQMIEENRERHEIQVGINPMGSDWTSLHQKLRENSPFVIAGDFGNYDRGNPAENLECSGNVINRIYNDSETNQKIRHILMTTAYTHLSLVDNFVVVVDKGLPSGYPLTSVVNSVNNDIYKYMAWLHLAPQEYKSLDNCDSMTTSAYYGDDHLHSVKQEALKFFNLRTLGKFFSESGIKYTDEHKNDWREAEEFSTLGKVSFLKRGFVEDKSGFILSPLSKETIEGRYLMWMKSPNVEEYEILTELIQNSLRDAMMWGPEYFDEQNMSILKALQSVGCSDIMPILSYRSEYDRWIRICSGELLDSTSYISGQNFGL